MAIKRQQNWLGQQRVDVADLRSLESGVTADFDVLGGKLMSGRVPLVARGFTISTTNAAGNPADQLQLSVAGGLLIHFGAAEAGSLFVVDDNASAETLNASNTRVVGSFTASSTNYIGLDLRRSEDATTSDLKQFLDANTEQEVPKTVPTARTLDYRIIISTQPFSVASNVCPVAKVVTNASNLVTSVTDARRLMFRLGSGGDNPDPAGTYLWADSDRYENPVTFDQSTSSADPFVGGDKGITSLKEWMDAVMARLWETGSGEFWYSATARDNVKLLYGPVTFPVTENFVWNSGTNTLTWEGLKLAFENSPSSYYNVIQDGSEVLNADGQCLYVDLQRDTNGATIIPAVGELISLGSPALPGSRFILAWREDGEIFTRDRAYEVGREFAAATTTTVGVVQLNAAPVSAIAPEVVVTDASERAVAQGVTRGSFAAGALAVGTGANDTSVVISRVGATIEMDGTTDLNGTTNLNSTVNVNGNADFNNPVLFNDTVQFDAFVNVNANCDVVGVLDVTGDIISAANLDIGGTADVTGTITSGDYVEATTEFSYVAAKTKQVHVAACSMQGIQNSDPVVGSSTLPAGWQKANATGVFQVSGQLHIPEGASVTGVQVLIKDDGVAENVTVQMYSMSKSAGSYSAVTTLVNSAQATSGSGAHEWLTYVVTNAQGPSDGLIWFNIQIPSTLAGTIFEFRALRATYSVTDLKPSI